MNKKSLQAEVGWDKLLDLFFEAKSKETLEMLFQFFTTTSEREMLIKRYHLVQALLSTDLPQREIASRLKLSISKVTAGSKAIQSLSDADQEYLSRKLK